MHEWKGLDAAIQRSQHRKRITQAIALIACCQIAFGLAQLLSGYLGSAAS